MAIHEKLSLPTTSGVLPANKDVAPPGPTDLNEVPDMDDQDEAPVNGKVGSPKSRKNNISSNKSEGRGSSLHSDNKLFGFVTRSQESSSRKVNLLFFNYVFLIFNFYFFLALPDK